MRAPLLRAALSGALLLRALAQPLAAPGEELMSTLGGTAQKLSSGAGSQEPSFGNVLPEAQLPWAMNGWSPVTSLTSDAWFFSAADRHFFGVRCTHQPSPWLGDYAQFRVASAIVDPAHGAPDAWALYDPAAPSSVFKPYEFSARLLSFGTRAAFATVSLAPTAHGAIFRFTFPPADARANAAGYNQTRRVLIALDAPGADVLALAPEGAERRWAFAGAATSCGTGSAHACTVPAGFGHHFYATLSAGGDGGAIEPAAAAVRTDAELLWAFADFAAADARADVIELRVATSFISAAQARVAHAAEVANVSYAAAAAAARAAWRDVAARVAVADLGGAGADAAAVFYSSLYRASKYPRSLAETLADGSTAHYSPYDGRVHAGELSTDVGFWDAYRTTGSLTALWAPARLAAMMDGWLAAFREGGWVPQWSSPGYRGAMTGTMSDVTLSEAVVKLPACAGTGGARDDGGARAAAAGYCVNASALYAASRKNAFEAPPPGTPEGRVCLAEYEALGYVPSDACDSSVTRTVNYWHSDWSLARAAEALGEAADARVLDARAARFATLLEPSSGGFLVPRTAAGAFNLSTFDEVAWGGGFTEAGPWQYRYEVPYAPRALAAALAAAGVDACATLDDFNTMPSIARPGTNAGVTHEMAEMALNCWGQWELNNQPVWVVQHMGVGMDSGVAGPCAQRAQPRLRRSAALFRAGADMFPGDEDNGSMGAWYILNALGLYPLAPASGQYTLGSPLFANVTIDVGGGRALTIVANGQSPARTAVAAVRLNGVAVAGTDVAYEALMRGGLLEFDMILPPA